MKKLCIFCLAWLFIFCVWSLPSSLADAPVPPHATEPVRNIIFCKDVDEFEPIEPGDTLPADIFCMLVKLDKPFKELSSSEYVHATLQSEKTGMVFETSERVKPLSKYVVVKYQLRWEGKFKVEIIADARQAGKTPWLLARGTVTLVK